MVVVVVEVVVVVVMTVDVVVVVEVEVVMVDVVVEVVVVVVVVAGVVVVVEVEVLVVVVRVVVVVVDVVVVVVDTAAHGLSSHDPGPMFAPPCWSHFSGVRCLHSISFSSSPSSALSQPVFRGGRCSGAPVREPGLAPYPAYAYTSETAVDPPTS